MLGVMFWIENDGLDHTMKNRVGLSKKIDIKSVFFPGYLFSKGNALERVYI